MQAVASCWEGEYQFYRCCIRSDQDCWNRPGMFTEVRCCLEEPPLARRYGIRASPVEFKKHCTGTWAELRQSIVHQKQIPDVLRIASHVHSAGPCLPGEATLAALDIYVWLLRSGSLQRTLDKRFFSARFLVHALSALLMRASNLGHMHGASKGWPLFSILHIIREHLEHLESVRSLHTVGCAATRSEAVHGFKVVQRALKQQNLEGNQLVLQERALIDVIPIARHRIAMKRAELGCHQFRCERVQLISVGLAYAKLMRHCTGASKNCYGASHSLGTALKLASREFRTAGMRTLKLFLLSAWPVLTLMDDLEALEPIMLCPIRLLAYYRLGAHAPVNIHWPQPYHMRLLKDDSISINIRAVLLPFCGSPLYLRWITNLWRGNFQGPVRIVEGGSEAGSCLLWAAGMLDDRHGSGVDFSGVGIEPMPAAVTAFRESIIVNGWDDKIKAFQAAVDNSSSDASGDGHDGLHLQVPLGRVGEASAVACAAGDCSTITATRVRLDDVLDAGQVVHLLKLNVMGFERDALFGAADLLFGGRICSVLLEELPGRGGIEAVQRMAAIETLLRRAGFHTQVFARDHGEIAANARHRVSVQQIMPNQFTRIAFGLHQLSPSQRAIFGFIVAGWLPNDNGACAATSPPFRPDFEPVDFGDVLRMHLGWTTQRQGTAFELQAEHFRARSAAIGR